MKIKQPTTFIVGAGAVATALAGALRHAGAPVLGLWARRPHEARLAAAVAGVAAYASPPDSLLECDVVIFAVSDDGIAEAAERLTATGLLGTRHTLIHCSGARAAVDVFAAVAARVGGIATMHPLAAVAKGRVGITQLRGISYGIEGNATGLAVAQHLVAALHGNAIELSGAQMARYHLAANFASNFVVTLIDQAIAMFVSAGLSEDQAREVATSLARSATDNVEAKGAALGLTGPIRRGDARTIERHLDELAGYPEAKGLYLALAAGTLGLASRAGLSAAEAAGVATLLSKKP